MLFELKNCCRLLFYLFLGQSLVLVTEELDLAALPVCLQCDFNSIFNQATPDVLSPDVLLKANAHSKLSNDGLKKHSVI